MSDLSGRTIVVVGASRGLGRGIARAFAKAGAPVVAIARTGTALAELATTARTSGPRSRMRPTRRWRGACCFRGSRPLLGQTTPTLATSDPFQTTVFQAGSKIM